MRSDTGSKSWDDWKKDQSQYDFQLNFPATSQARTTFYAREANNERKFDRFWSLQHGRGHTFEGWNGQRVRPENEFTYRRARVILSQAGVPESIRARVANRVVTEDLTGFSRYYKGVDGAAIGFASLYEYETKEAAETSYLVAKAEDLLDIDGVKLVSYVWRKYGPSLS